METEKLHLNIERSQSETGATYLEATLVIPAFLFFVLNAISFSQLLLTKIQMNDALGERGRILATEHESQSSFNSHGQIRLDQSKRGNDRSREEQNLRHSLQRRWKRNSDLTLQIDYKAAIAARPDQMQEDDILGYTLTATQTASCVLCSFYSFIVGPIELKASHFEPLEEL